MNTPLTPVTGYSPNNSGQEFLHTKQFIGVEYKVNNKSGEKLQYGDIVWVHPSEKSQSREPFKAVVLFLWIKWTNKPCVEVMTNVIGGYSSVVNDYLFNRLELITRKL